MHSVEILNNYRHSLADDRLGTVILASLLSVGAQSEGKLLDRSGSSAREVKHKLDELYRASLLEMASANRFRISRLGRTVLSSFGITAGIFERLLEKLQLKPERRAFYSVFVSYAHDAGSDADAILSLAKCASYVSAEREAYFSRSRSLERYLQAAIVGLSPTATLLDAESLCLSMRHRPTTLWLEHLSDLPRAIDLKLSTQLCEQAKLDVQRSNAYFILGYKGLGKPSLLTRYLSETRVLSALTTGKLDDQLSVLYFSGHGAESVSNILADQQFLSTCRRALGDEGIMTGEEDLAEVAERARRRMADIIVSMSPPPAPASQAADVFHYGVRPSLTGARRTLVDQIRAIADLLDSNSLNNSDRETLRATIARLKATLKPRG